MDVTACATVNFTVELVFSLFLYIIPNLLLICFITYVNLHTDFSLIMMS